MPRRPVPGIFCLEGLWSPRLTDQASVKPLLELLEEHKKVRFLHWRISSISELESTVSKWPQRQYERFSLGYFGFHGVPGRLLVGRRYITLEQMGDVLAGQCTGKTLYFGSCGVLGIKQSEVEQFRRRTKARCVIGFKEQDVDWMVSAAFDLVLFDALTAYQRMDAVERYMKRNQPALVKKLGFRMFYG
jgi:hypothetical protein